MILAVFDTNVWISSLIRPDNPPGQLRRAAQEDWIELCCSRALLDELEGILARPKFAQYIRVSREDVELLLELIPKMSFFVEKLGVEPIITDDPDDDIVLATALATSADVIISGDQHLLSLGVYQGIQIINAAETMRLLEKSRG